MQYWPFCSNSNLLCDPTPAVVFAPFIFLAILMMTTNAIIYFRDRKLSQPRKKKSTKIKK